jgi:electron transfer flavoprotein alpha subunit
MILVLVETDAGGVVEVSRETITFCRELSRQGGGVPIDALLVGRATDQLVAELGQYGVREVHEAGGDAFAAYSGAAWAAALQAVREAKGSVVVAAAGTPRGGEVLAHLAARLDVAMAANVVAFEGLAPFVVTRQVVGGAALEEMRLDDRPALFTVAGHAVEPAPAPEPTTPAVYPVDVRVDERDLVARVVAVEPRGEDLSGDLKSARVVVGGGRGVGGPDGFPPLLELAEALGGQLGVSRVVTSLGWRPHHEQVGQTGSRIAPEVYLPCGISGAIQHWAGCASSKVIVAVNTDPDAPMVTKADYAVIGDLHEVVPAVVAELRRRA